MQPVTTRSYADEADRVDMNTGRTIVLTVPEAGLLLQFQVPVREVRKFFLIFNPFVV